MHTGQAPHGGNTYQSQTDANARSQSPPLRIKIVQRATVAVLNAIYEEDFLGFSYGFRLERGQHDALDALAVGISLIRHTKSAHPDF